MRLFASRMRAAGHHQIIKPIGSHASIQGGFTKDDFTINLAALGDLPSWATGGDQPLR